MKKKRLLFGLLLLFPFAGVVHAMVFPQETRCILIDFYDFEQSGQLYYRKGVDPATIAQLESMLASSESRVDEFYGEKTVTPAYIYCDSDEDFLKFGVPFLAPACANMKLGAYVVISKTGLVEDIIAHEIAHTELYNRIGFFNRLRKIPTWFDEGLAMQLDTRPGYSEDSLWASTAGFNQMPDVTQLITAGQFGGGTSDEVYLNYATAKYEVGKWYTPAKLDLFIEAINQGASFEEAYALEE